MRNYKGSAMLGLRDNDTNRIIAVYPDPLDGGDPEAEEKVKFWFYQQSCGAEEQLRNCYVDLLSEKELEMRKIPDGGCHLDKGSCINKE